ncbi:MAG TPA: hypothetical protein VD993_03745 [Chitinophagaceae bacterium]|nr:hypothetical protein [Chitinophagaceae bacterium]
MEKWMSKYKRWHTSVITSYRDRFEELLKTIDAIAFGNMDERLEVSSVFMIKDTKERSIQTPEKQKFLQIAIVWHRYWIGYQFFWVQAAGFC